MSRPVRRWWATRSLTLRLTIVATVVLGIGLVAGAAGLATLFFHSRVAAVDADVGAESATVTSLVASGQLPDPLPAPAAQPVLAQVLDSAGTVLAATPSASRVVPVLPPGVISSVSAGHPFTTTSSAFGAAPLRVVVSTTRLHGATVTIVCAVPFTDVRGTLDALLRVLVIAVPLVLLAAAGATWLAVSSALRPVDELRAAADAVAQTPQRAAPHLPVPESGDEIARLADTLNRMLDRLHRGTEQQRAFVADAAHELRSPVASIRTQLDVALTTPTDEHEWAEVGRDVRTDVDRIGRLADDLLLLARLDVGTPQHRQAVDLAALIGRGGPPVWVNGDAPALRRAIDNLVANARRHARGRVEVAATLDGLDAVVTVDDDGPGVAADDRERVFERWMRLDDARARDDGGAGLGLPIARSVARSHGGDVVLLDSPLGGARAVLRLPTND
ncbi:MAG: sensor histidine kinase [Nocardioidaceae bacterium]